MSKDEDKPRARIQEAAEIGVPVLHALVMAGPVAATSAATLALLPLVIGRAIPVFAERKAKEAREWWDWVVGVNAPAGTVGVDIGAHADDPAFHEVVVQAFRALVDAVAPDVIPALGLLTREYARQGKRPDYFFRAVARTLSDLESEEFRDLKTLLSLIMRGPRRGRIEMILSMLPDGSPVQVMFMDRTPLPVEIKWVPSGVSLPHGDRLFHLLKMHGVGEDNHGIHGLSFGKGVLAADFATMERLAAIIPS